MPSSNHHRYPPTHTHHGHPPRSPHHGYYVSGRGPHQHRHAPPEIPTSSPAVATAQQRPPYTPATIHPALVTPQTPRGPSTQHRHPASQSPAPPRVTSSAITSPKPPVAHKSNPNPEPINTANLVTTKPPRPYTEYTMFYQLEREYILHRILVDEDDAKAQAEQKVQAQNALFKDDPLMPQKYRTLPLRADWYISGKSKKPSKRKHSKTHGKIGFLELTRMIAARWSKVDDETRKYCKMMAAMELVKYKEDMESYNTYKARLEKMGEVPEDMKERERKKKAKDMKKEKLETSVVSTVGGNATKANGKTAGGAARSRKIDADAVESNNQQIARAGNNQANYQDNVDNDLEEYITSLVDEDLCSSRKRVSSPPPLPSTEAPWNHFMPGPRQDIRAQMTHMCPTAAASSKVITPERSSKRRKLPVHRDNNGRDAQSTHTEAVPVASNGGPVSPDEDELIHMTFSGIDEAEIAREFYFPSHANLGVSPGATSVSSTRVATLPGKNDAAAHPTNSTTDALCNPPVQSFDYWDALIDHPAYQAK